MSRDLTGNKSTNKLVMLIEPPHVKSGRKDKTPNPLVKPGIAQKVEDKNKISRKSTMRTQDNEERLLSTQSNHGVCKPIIRHPPAVGSQQEKKICKVTDVSLRKRLIHLLALKPYKKAELCERITKEGIDQRGRCVLMMILKQLTYLEEDTYYLRSCFRDEVQQDWPYYTEEEHALLNKSKAQSPTPGSSDGSGGSRQSSLDPGPPSLVRPPTPRLIYKRIRHHDGNDGVVTKKPRIAPYRKPESDSNNNNTTTFGGKGRTTDNISNNNSDKQGVTSAASNVSSAGSRSLSNFSSAPNTSSNGKSGNKKVKMLVSIAIEKIKVDNLKNGATLSG